MIPLLCAAWIGHTDHSRGMAEDIVKAFALIGVKHDAAAEQMGISPTKLSDQLAGREPLNHFRLAFLGISFEIALGTLRAARLGGFLITPEQIALMRGARRLGAKRMVKAGLGYLLVSDEERAS